jgi:hypothetical protein
MSSARVMVRALRENGILSSVSPVSELRQGAMLGLAAAAFGFVAYFAAAFVLPAVPHMFEQPHPLATFAKPRG